jgi:hypothetical protein
VCRAVNPRRRFFWPLDAIEHFNQNNKIMFLLKTTLSLKIKHSHMFRLWARSGAVG